jgi:hypothetical protein
MADYTTYADRQQIVMLAEQGHSYAHISQQTGWSYETVRQVCRRYKRDGPVTLSPQPLGRPSTGPLSSFTPLVRFAVLKLKRQHPGWGPDVIGAELAQRSWAKGVPLPCSSRIGTYLSQFGLRLLTPRSHKQLSRAQPSGPAAAVVHGCWQLDVDEGVSLPGYGRVNVLNMVDHTSGIKIGAALFPASQRGRSCRVSWPQYRQALRQAFSRWGLPDRIRTDRDRVIVPKDEYPFPMAFTLWLVGLGIEHELIRRVTQNGGVERSHRTWEGRLSGYGPFEQLTEWQMLADYERWRMNAVLPSRGRNCQRQPPLLVYPQVRLPRRLYRCQDELALFDLQRVQAYLAQGRWLRRTNMHGQFSLNGQVFNLRVQYANHWVLITYVPEIGFQATCPPDGQVILTFQMAGLTAADITGLPLNGV